MCLLFVKIMGMGEPPLQNKIEQKNRLATLPSPNLKSGSRLFFGLQGDRKKTRTFPNREGRLG